MAEAGAMEMYEARRIDRWDAIRRVRTPLVAAVSGFCLGGGNELAMACDLIVASETAQFGQPETGSGSSPAPAARQASRAASARRRRWTSSSPGASPVRGRGRAPGSSPASWRRRPGSRRRRRVASAIASKGPIAQRLAKESVNRAYESTLETGLDYERKALYLAFASEDAREGLTAFTEKRKPEFRGR